VQLGRYSAGGMERAMTLVTRKMHSRYCELRMAERAAATQGVAATK
jgi:hypothetical protein